MGDFFKLFRPKEKKKVIEKESITAVYGRFRSTYVNLTSDYERFTDTREEFLLAAKRFSEESDNLKGIDENAANAYGAFARALQKSQDTFAKFSKADADYAHDCHLFSDACAGFISSCGSHRIACEELEIDYAGFVHAHRVFSTALDRITGSKECYDCALECAESASECFVRVKEALDDDD